MDEYRTYIYVDGSNLRVKEQEATVRMTPRRYDELHKAQVKAGLLECQVKQLEQRNKKLEAQREQLVKMLDAVDHRIMEAFQDLVDFSARDYKD